jgi:hypothetical protein
MIIKVGNTAPNEKENKKASTPKTFSDYMSLPSPYLNLNEKKKTMPTPKDLQANL